MKVDVFCVGAQKSGTTSVHELLSKHPRVFLPEGKETHYFSWNHSVMSLIEYQNSFNVPDGSVSTNAVNMEVDPEYLYDPNSAERIYQFNPDAKIIVILRNPIDRAYSHYLMTKRRGLEPLDFYSALKAEEHRISRDNESNMHFSYLSRGRYAEQLRRYLALFPNSNVLTLPFESLQGEEPPGLARIFEFMGLQRDIQQTLPKHNRAMAPRSELLAKLLHPQTWRDLPGFKFLLLSPLSRNSQLRGLIKTIRAANLRSMAPDYRPIPVISRDYIVHELWKDLLDLNILTGFDYLKLWGLRNDKH